MCEVYTLPTELSFLAAVDPDCTLLSETLVEIRLSHSLCSRVLMNMYQQFLISRASCSDRSNMLILIRAECV